MSAAAENLQAQLQMAGQQWAVSLTGQKTAIVPTNLCSATPCGAGQYRISYYLDSTTACVDTRKCRDIVDHCLERRNRRQDNSSGALGSGSLRWEQSCVGRYLEFWRRQYLFVVSWRRANYLLDRLHSVCDRSGKLYREDCAGKSAVMQASVGHPCPLAPPVRIDSYLAT